MIEVTVSSELMNLANFFILDICLLSYIMHMSGRLAGCANHTSIVRQRTLRLVVFDIPLIGGGIVMPRGWRRSLFITLRISVVASVAVCNFGLEGRSRPTFITRESTIRLPGKLLSDFEDVTNVTEPYLRCANPGKGKLVFGSVLENQCYLGVKEFVYITELQYSLSNVSASATNCTLTTRCDTFSSVYKCKQADIICVGLESSAKCKQSVINYDSCRSVLYSANNNSAWYCNFGELLPGDENRTVGCRGLAARREDIQNWIEYYGTVTAEPLQAIFASAYGSTRTANITVPDGHHAVTEISIWWILPVSWIVAVIIIITVWRCAHCAKGSQTIAHDERGLSKLLRQQIDIKLLRDCI